MSLLLSILLCFNPLTEEAISHYHGTTHAIAPVTVEEVLRVAAEGACGTSYDAIGAAITPLSERPLQVHTSLWLDGRMELLSSFNPAPLFPLDLNGINVWVKTVTDGLIPQLLQPGDLDDDDRLVILSALTYKGNWKSPFSRLENPLWFKGNTKSSLLPFMTSQSRMGYSNNEELTAVSIPLQEGVDFLLLISHNELLSLSSEKILAVYDSLSSKRIALTLPLFSVETAIDLRSLFERVGLSILYTEQADFSRMTTTPVALRKAFAKTVLEINEKGLSAASAAGLAIGVTSTGDPIYTSVNVDHPFAFVLLDRKSRSILFSGEIWDLPSP